MASSAKKIKELDEKLLAAENLCAKFLESGRYWRQERNQKKTGSTAAPGASSGKIVMPIHGGKAKPLAAEGAASNYGAAASSGGAGGPSAPSSPAPPAAAAASTGRQSGSGLASGARSAITSISSAMGGIRDPMARFF